MTRLFVDSRWRTDFGRDVRGLVFEAMREASEMTAGRKRRLSNAQLERMARAAARRVIEALEAPWPYPGLTWRVLTDAQKAEYAEDQRLGRVDEVAPRFWLSP
jgi:hypothetical protein